MRTRIIGAGLALALSLTLLAGSPSPAAAHNDSAHGCWGDHYDWVGDHEELVQDTGQRNGSLKLTKHVQRGPEWWHWIWPTTHYQWVSVWEGC